MGGISTKKQKKQSTFENYVNRIEIPAINFHHAVDFYNQICDIELAKIESGDYLMAFSQQKEESEMPLSEGPAQYQMTQNHFST